MSRLTLQDMGKSYRGKTVVEKVNLTVHQGKVTGLLGPNGAGKTTTFYMCIGLIRPDRGKVSIGQEDITRCPMYQRAAKGIGYLPQEACIFKKLTVEQNITAILEVVTGSRKKSRIKAQRIMEELGIHSLASQKAASLSGGERRRLEISRVLATDPLFVLLDEPFAGVDPLAVIDIQQIIGTLTSKGIGVLISDHNVRETLGVCDQAYIMDQGSVIASGSPEEILASKTARKAYLGDHFSL